VNWITARTQSKARSSLDGFVGRSAPEWLEDISPSFIPF
jgi:hypothetical protein